MEVLYWQLLVFGSVFAVRYFSNAKHGIIVAIGWSAWTFLMISSGTLTIVQLGSAWVGFAAASALRSTRAAKAALADELGKAKSNSDALSAELADLRATLDQMPAGQRQLYADAADRSDFRVLTGR